MTHIISGKEIANNIRNQLKKEIIQLKNKYEYTPGLAVVQVGNNPASSVYVKAKTKNAQEVGIEVIDHHLRESVSQKELLLLIDTLNNQDRRFITMLVQGTVRLSGRRAFLGGRLVPGRGAGAHVRDERSDARNPG